ncbi:hypothetical protein [uncultured Gammaproteobacteria bacterium]|nr:hypothetical protein [uncultured Gammaproteobacteria bacterium]
MKSKENTQNFLLSAQARSISVAKVARMSDGEVYKTFKSICWSANNGNPICHHCGSIECWSFKTYQIFKCKDCDKQFSVTSGTIFANRKLPMRDYLLAITLFVNAHKGLSALQLSRDLGVQYKLLLCCLIKFVNLLDKKCKVCLYQDKLKSMVHTLVAISSQVTTKAIELIGVWPKTKTAKDTVYLL